MRPSYLEYLLFPCQLLGASGKPEPPCHQLIFDPRTNGTDVGAVRDDVPARPRERKRRHRGDGLRGDIGGWTWEVGAAAADCQGHRPSTQASGGVIRLGGEALSVELMDLGGLCMVVFTCRIREEVRNKGVLVHLGIGI